MERNTEAAFKWIVSLLHKHNIPFQISGGFAAKLYGSNRELADIDIGIPDTRFEELLPEVKDYLIYGPEHYLDAEWDLKLMTLKYDNQEIDIAGRDEIKIFDKAQGVWVPAHRDMTISNEMVVFGLKVPIIPKELLIAYKKKIMREVDQQDIKALEIEEGYHLTPLLRRIQILLLILIIIGIGLLLTQSYWVPKLVDYILRVS